MQRPFTPIYDPRIKPRLGCRLDKGDPINRGLAGRWLFNEGAGNLVQDVSGNRIGGAITGATWGSAPDGSCVAFDGTGDRIDFGIYLAAIDYSKDYTVVFSGRYPELESGNKPIVAQVRGSSDRMTIGLVSTSGAGNYLIFSHYNGSAYNARLVTGLTADAWHQIICTNDIAQSKAIYVDGIRADTTSGSYNPGFSAQTLRVGQDLYGNELTGNVGYLTVYGRLLSPSEIARLYRDPYAGIARSRIELWSAAGSGGGTTVSPTASDSLTLSESVVAQITPLIASATDSLTVSESVTTEVTPLEAVVQDSLTVSETVESILTPLLATATDSITLSEETTAEVGGYVSAVAQDGLTLSETVAAEVSPLLAVATDSLTLSETVAAELPVLEAEVSDSLTLSEEASVETSGVSEAVAQDNVVLSESVSAEITPLLAVAAESVTISETVTAQLNSLEVVVADSLTLSESVVADVPQTGAIAVDTITLSESVAVELTPLLALASDAITLSESIIAVRSPLEVTVEESLTLSEVVSATGGAVSAAVAFFMLKHRR